MSENSHKAWPIAIISSILACVAASVATIIISLDYPVEMDSAYLSTYKAVDAKINDILANQKEFEAKYRVKFISDDEISISLKNNQILSQSSNDNNQNDTSVATQNNPAKTSDKKQLENALDGLKCAALLTRPETNSHNLDIACSIIKDKFIIKLDLPKTFAKDGRWQILLRVSDGDISGFFKREFFVKS